MCKHAHMNAHTANDLTSYLMEKIEVSGERFLNSLPPPHLSSSYMNLYLYSQHSSFSDRKCISSYLYPGSSASQYLAPSTYLSINCIFFPFPSALIQCACNYLLFMLCLQETENTTISDLNK